MKFRKKPVVIDALQLRWDTWQEMCEFAGVGKLSDGKPSGCFVDPVTRTELPEGSISPSATIGLRIPSLEGTILAIENDWIIRGIKGELYPCKPDIFESSYEPVASTEFDQLDKPEVQP